MDFANYLHARRATDRVPALSLHKRIQPMRHSEMFNPSARDGVLCWVGLRMIPVSIILAAVATWVS